MKRENVSSGDVRGINMRNPGNHRQLQLFTSTANTRVPILVQSLAPGLLYKNPLRTPVHAWGKTWTGLDSGL